MTTNAELQSLLIKWGLLDPPADGLFGKQSKRALQYACKLLKLDYEEDVEKLMQSNDPIPVKLSNDFASRIVAYMLKNNFHISKGSSLYNIVYVEGCNDDGTPNNNTFNTFGDLRIVIEISEDGSPKIIGMWNATTNSGDYYTYNRMNSEGAANIQFGQYKAWSVGIHGNSRPHEALIQVADITVCRDANEDGKRAGDATDTGLFGVDQHSAFDAPLDDVGMWSAGCLVGRTTNGHKQFMSTVKQDARYLTSDTYVFMTTVIDGKDLAKVCPID